MMAKHVAKAHDDFRERIATKMLADAKLVPGVVRRDSRGRGIPDDDWWVGEFGPACGVDKRLFPGGNRANFGYVAQHAGGVVGK